MASPNELTTATRMLDVLDDAVKRARAAVEGGSAWLSGWDLKRGNEAGLDSAQNAINSLRKFGLPKLQNGTSVWTYSYFKKQCDDLRATINSYADDVANWDSWAILKNTATASAADIKTGATIATPVIGIVLLAVGFLYVSIIFRR